VEFEAAYRAAARLDVAPGVTATFLGRHDLIRLKREAGRPQDLLDVEMLAQAEREGADDGE
jgi:hypothetical protein